MNTPDDSLRNRLLSQYVPEPAKLANYRKEIETMLELEERKLRWQALGSALLWCWAVFLGTGFALAAGYSRELPTKVYFSLGITVMALFFYGSVEMLKFVIDRARLRVVKDIKGLELRLLELEGRLAERS
jgi:hypothetical protein